MRDAQGAFLDAVEGQLAGLDHAGAVAFLPTSLAGSPVPGRWQAAAEQVARAVTPAPPAGAAAGVQPGAPAAVRCCACRC